MSITSPGVTWFLSMVCVTTGSTVSNAAGRVQSRSCRGFPMSTLSDSTHMTQTGFGEEDKTYKENGQKKKARGVEAWFFLKYLMGKNTLEK